MIVIVDGKPRCGCCGADEETGRLVLVVPGEDLGSRQYRCEKHIGRNPCCIPGCGRTYAHRADDADGRGAENYSWRLICGRHWRQAPKYMRDAVARVRRDARCQGWTDRNHNRHSRLWERCRRAVECGGTRLDPREIDRMFGWDGTA